MADDSVQKLLDIQAIIALKSKYCRCVDTKDWAGFESLLTEDYVTEADGLTHTGRAAAMAAITQSMGAVKTSVFHVHNPEIVVTGDTATGVWAQGTYILFDMGPGMKFSMRGYGWYHEDYVRTPDGWKLKKCVEHRQRVDVEGEVPDQMAAHLATMPVYNVVRTNA